MNTENPFEPYLEEIQSFVDKLNALCKSSGKNYITITPAANLERTEPYQKDVSHFFEYQGNSVEIFARQKGFFKHHAHHPLMTIETANGQFSFKGLHCRDIKTNALDQLPEALEQYLNICESLPTESFIKV